MPIRFLVDPEARVVTVSTSGRPTAADACEFLDAVIADPLFERGFGFLNDRRSTEGPDDPGYMADCLLAFGERADRLFPCRWAVIVRPPVDAAAAWLASALVAPHGMHLRAFGDPNEAFEWLHAPDG